MFWNNSEKLKYNFTLNNVLCQKNNLLLLLLTFHVSFLSFLDAEKYIFDICFNKFENNISPNLM